MNNPSEEPEELKIRSRPSQDVTLQIPDDTLNSMQKVAVIRDMSVEALMKFYIGQGLRHDLAHELNFENLMQIVSPPNLPIDTGSEELWQEAEARLGNSFPTDYKWFIETYGTGKFTDSRETFVYNPFSKVYNLFSWKEEILHSYQMACEHFPDECPFSAFPENNGLLPVGGNSNGDTLYWLTRGAPDEWVIVLYDDDCVVYEEFPTSITGYLTGLFSGRIIPRLYAEANSHGIEPVNFKPIEK